MFVRQTITLLLALFLIFPAFFAHKTWALDQAMIDLGYAVYGGKKGKSLGGSGSGANGGYFHFQSEMRKGYVRPNIAARIEIGFGDASLGSTTSSFTLMGGSFEPGLDFFVFKTEYIKPFIGAGGILGWYALTMDGTTQNLAFGYFISGGAEIRKKAQADARAIRLQTTYRILSGKFAETGGFQLNAILFSIGLVF